MKREINEQEIKEAILNSTNFCEAARKICICRKLLKKKAKELGIDYSHFRYNKPCADMLGEKFGKLIVQKVIKVEYKRKDRQITYRQKAICLCECGKVVEIRCDRLVCGERTSCGCGPKDRWSMVGCLNPAFQGVGEIRASYFKALERNAQRRNLPFSVTKDYVWKLYLNQNKRCALTGLPISFGRVSMRKETTASLDRIDSSKGYVEGNVAWVLKDVNMLKVNLSNEYFIRLCNLVAKQHPRDLEPVIPKAEYRSCKLQTAENS
jgi:hypothetical protein